MFKCKISPDYVMDPRNNECSYAADGNMICKTNNKIVPKPVVVDQPPPKAVETFFNKKMR